MTTPLSEAVTAEIRRLMEARDISVYALAKQSGIPQSSLNRKFNKDEPGRFDLDDVQKLAPVFGVDAADIVAWAERRARHPKE